MSNEAKHTPGPWRMHDMESFTVVAGKPSICIANANALHRSEAENDANARLIAAAPDLLEENIQARTTLGMMAMLALQSDLEGVQEIARTLDISLYGGVPFVASPAIAKAEGAE